MHSRLFGAVAMLALSACIDPLYNDDVADVFGNEYGTNPTYVVGVNNNGSAQAPTKYVSQCESITDTTADVSFCADKGLRYVQCPNVAFEHMYEEGFADCHLLDDTSNDGTLICCYKQ